MTTTWYCPDDSVMVMSVTQKDLELIADMSVADFDSAWRGLGDFIFLRGKAKQRARLFTEAKSAAVKPAEKKP